MKWRISHQLKSLCNFWERGKPFRRRPSLKWAAHWFIIYFSKSKMPLEITRLVNIMNFSTFFKKKKIILLESGTIWRLRVQFCFQHRCQMFIVTGPLMRGVIASIPPKASQWACKIVETGCLRHWKHHFRVELPNIGEKTSPSQHHHLVLDLPQLCTSLKE